MKKIGVFLFVLSFSQIAHAGFNGITHHSRANCVNNESISWDWTHYWWFWVRSEHINAVTGNTIHTLSTAWKYTWRAAAVHWGEGRGGWMVRGTHWMTDRRGNAVLVQQELVNNCSIYDGWWDRNK